MLALADVVIVPTWRDVHERAPEAVLQALRDAHARGPVLVGLCLGAFVLAQGVCCAPPPRTGPARVLAR